MRVTIIRPNDIGGTEGGCGELGFQVNQHQDHESITFYFGGAGSSSPVYSKLNFMDVFQLLFFGHLNYIKCHMCYSFCNKL